MFFILYWLLMNLATPFLSQAGAVHLSFNPMSPHGPFWVIIAVAVCTDANIPSLMSRGPFARPPLEFFLTRAVDRSIYFRAKMLGIAVLLLAPVLLSVVISCFQPSLAVALRGEVPGLTLQRIQQAFPDASLQSNTILLPRGNVALALWHLWCGISVFALAHVGASTSAPIAKRLRPNLALLLIFLLWGSIWFGLYLSVGRSIRSYEGMFLSFCTRPLLWFIPLVAFALVVQIYCERRFRDLELP